ncbi:FAD-dependent oxidoreductase [Nocardioides sambongensis]|uniref:FAD-dependent oxidoreductase n=1 Tax=Nocardioides sambongensis TaxID=2589074 RepID=UPI001E3A5A60|nr:FAD-dependent oxidoreductase [Nocardioides sambongensis]
MSVARLRVVVAGLGDTGVLTAMHLARHADVVGIATKPGLVSGQELGLRLARPEQWSEDYWIGFDRLRGLDRVEVRTGRAVHLDREARSVTVEAADGTRTDERYDALVISTGVSNGFWRDAGIEDASGVAERLRDAHVTLARAASIVVVGAGAAGVSSAYNAAVRWPDATVDLYFPGEAALPQHHRRVWRDLAGRLRAVGVGLHPGHRAVVPDEAATGIGAGPVAWSTGQAPTEADAVLWTVGRVRPHTDWLPAELLDEHGFVRVRPTLQTALDGRVFAVGDVAATDPLRSSARNRADRLLARNVRAVLDAGTGAGGAGAGGGPGDLDSFTAPRRRWGSVLGFQDDGLRIYAPDGRSFRVPRWSVDRLLKPVVVRRGIYGGIRPRRAKAPLTR